MDDADDVYVDIDAMDADAVYVDVGAVDADVGVGAGVVQLDDGTVNVDVADDDADYEEDVKTDVGVYVVLMHMLVIVRVCLGFL